MDDTPSTPNAPKQAAKPRRYGAPAGAAKSDVQKAARPAAKSARRPARRRARAATKLEAVTITIDPTSAEVIRVEGLDKRGTRHDLTDEEKATLMTEVRRDGRLEEVLEHAFEAGLACVLGDAAEDEADAESPDEEELRHQLLAPLMKRSLMGRLTERAALNRAVLGTLIASSRNDTTVH
jgi:hypothetical protein